MALRQTEQVQLDSINQTVKILAELGTEQTIIEDKMKSMIAPLEASANCKLIFKQDEQGARFDVIELKSDFVRTRSNPDQTLLSLKAKIYGLPIDVKVKKDDDTFTNAQVAKSLSELATLVAAMPVEMLANPHDDWSRTPGEMPKGMVSADSDDDEEDSVPEQTISTATSPELPAEAEASTPVVDAPQTELPATEATQETVQAQVTQSELPAAAAPDAHTPASPQTPVTSADGLTGQALV